MATEDKSTQAAKRNIAHFTRVLTAWWKAAHFVQNKDTAKYYGRLVELALQSPNTLYQWPRHIEGVYIDARGAEEARENPKISFEYEAGYESLANSTQSRQVTTRSYATGGTLKTAQAQKRLRTEDADAAPEPARETDIQQQQLRLLSMEDLETPANSKKNKAPGTSTPAAQRSGQADPSTMTSPPFNDTMTSIQESPAPHLSQYYGGPTGSPNPPPHTPAEEGEQIQVTQSSRKINIHGPRASSRTDGVERHC